MSKRLERDTLSSVVIEATQKMLAQTSESCAHFATMRLVPLLEIEGLITSDGVDNTADAYIRWRNRHIKQVERIINADIRMPIDWVITWISALPEPFRGKCQIKVAALLGLMSVQLPTYRRGQGSVDAEIDSITIKFGDVLARAEPAHDGVYDNNDSHDSLKKLQNKLFELIADVQREMNNIESATGVAPDALSIGRCSPLLRGL